MKMDIEGGTDTELSSLVSEEIDHRNSFSQNYALSELLSRIGSWVYIVAICWAIAYVLILPFNDIESLPALISLSEGTRMHIQSNECGLYMRVLPQCMNSSDMGESEKQKSICEEIKENDTDELTNVNHRRLVFTENISWSLGGSFDVVYDLPSGDSSISIDGCFYMRTMFNSWLRVTSIFNSVSETTSYILTTTNEKNEASLFSAYALNGAETDNFKNVGFKLCAYSFEHKSPLDLWMGVGSFVSLLASRTISISRDRAAAILDSSIMIGMIESHGALSKDIPVFSITFETYTHGVNLGGWFIPEVWMLQSFFSGSELNWAGSLCRMVEWNRMETEKRMVFHLSTWITESDFQQIAAFGFNSVRIPVGYWNIIDDPYSLFAPADVGVSLQYLFWAFDIAEKYGLSVLLDLHGAPGSQNGIDHSGCSKTAEWMMQDGENSSQDDPLEKYTNILLSLKTIQRMSELFGSRVNLKGIELVNEPLKEYEDTSWDVLLLYYQNAYRIIRSHCSQCDVVFNELYMENFHKWDAELLESQGFYNVIFDMHLYDWQEPFTSESVPQHISDAIAWSAVIQNATKLHPVIVGEWSMSTGEPNQAGQPFVDACETSFRIGSFGWYIWNWKIERLSSGDDLLVNSSALYSIWDTQYQLSDNERLHISFI